MNNPRVLENEEWSDDLLNTLIKFAVDENRRVYDFRTIIRGFRSIAFRSRPFYRRRYPVEAVVYDNLPSGYTHQKLSFQNPDDIKTWLIQNLGIEQHTLLLEFDERWNRLDAIEEAVEAAVVDKLRRARFSIPGVRVRHGIGHPLTFETEDGVITLQLVFDAESREDK